MKLRATVLLAALIASCSALATPAALVDAVQLPAWRLRGDKTEPLAPGMDVQNGDRLQTGTGARVYLKLAEGSTIKLGESAALDFHTHSLKPQRFFRGALDVLTGAFRFTTAQAAKLRQRDVAIRVGTATIGIRGTDVWGKSGDEQDLVMLIEGHIEVKAVGRDPIEMVESLSVFLAPKGAEPLPLSTATEEELASRSAETDIDPSNGALRRKGRFSLRLGDALDEPGALVLYDQTRKAGYPARIRPVADGKDWRYEVLLKGFASRKEAEQAAGPLSAALKLPITATR